MIGAIRNRLPMAGYLAVGLVTAVLVFLDGRASHGGTGAASGAEAPAFRLDALDGADSVDLANFSGRVVVVNFWASWCGPCRDEASTLEDAWRRWSRRGAEFIGVDTRDSADDARAFVNDHGITYPIAVDAAGETADEYGVRAMPQTFIISRSGMVVNQTVGPVSEAKINDDLRTVLHRGPSASTRSG
jgi:cytochrome c biogenesis protein CcmG, thiol:disulfide interchange protein DsbE